MNIPYDGKVNIRFVVKRFKNKVFYYVNEFDNYKFSFKPCVLAETSFINFPFVRYFDNEMRLNTSYSQGACWERLFERFEDAEKEVKRLNSLYFDGFYKKPFLKIKTLENHKKDLLRIEKDINKLLNGFENFLGIDFCDVSANGIQIRGHHKRIRNYTYGQQPTIKYDFSNKEEIVMKFVSMWFKYDTEDMVKRELDFISDGEKYGWD
jgi:hypothetical protein